MSKFRGTRDFERRDLRRRIRRRGLFNFNLLLDPSNPLNDFSVTLYFIYAFYAFVSSTFFELESMGSCKYSLRHKVQAWKISFRYFNLVSKSLFSLHFVSRFGRAIWKFEFKQVHRIFSLLSVLQILRSCVNLISIDFF